MRIAISVLLTALVVLCLQSTLAAHVWVQDGGSLNINAGGLSYRPDMACYNGVPYVTWMEDAQLYVKRWNGSSWELLSGTINTNSASNPSLAVDGGIPYIAWEEFSGGGVKQIFVKYWNGSSWQPVDGVGNCLNIDPTKNAYAYDGSLAVYNGTPYVTWYEHDAANHAQIYVKRYNGSAWAPLTAGNISLNVNTGVSAENPSLAFYQGTPYLAWTEYNAQAYMKYWNGTAWVLDGGGISTAGWADYLSLSVAGGVPYVSYQEYASESNITVKHWNGSAWAADGGVYVNVTAYARHSSVAVLSGTPYVAWEEDYEGGLNGVYVKHWNGGAWVRDGVKVNNVDGFAQNPSLCLAGLFPYVAWEEDEQIYVKHELADRISSVQPRYSLAAGAVQVTVIGAGVNGTPTARLLRAGCPDIVGTAWVKNGDYNYTFTFNLDSAPAGVYDVQVTGAGDNGVGELKQAFTLYTVPAGPLAWYIHDLGQAGIQTNIQNFCDLAIGDANGDNQQELYIANRDQSLFKYTKVDSAWNRIAVDVSASLTFGRIVLADGNADQRWELFTGSASNSHVFICSTNTLTATADLGADSYGTNQISALAKADLHHDGVMRIYAAGSYAGVTYGVSEYVYNGEGWWVSGIPGCPWSRANGMTGGDGDNDGAEELFSANDDASVYYYQLNGIVWQVDPVGTGTGQMFDVAVGDGDNDGDNEVYAANQDGRMYQFRWNGAAWASATLGQALANSLCAVAVSDADNDGANEVYGACYDGHVYMYKKSGTDWTRTDLGDAGAPLYALAAGDADNDHHLDLYALGQNNRVYQYQYSSAPTATPTFTVTPTFGPTATVTPTPIPDSEKRLRVFPSRINPAKGERSVIRWYQSGDAEVTVYIYNLLGDKIATPAENRSFAAGRFQNVSWDGRTDSGAVVGSGIYIVLLQSGNEQTWTKIAVIK